MKKMINKKSHVHSVSWHITQDCYLIENSSLPDEELQKHLPFSVDEIHERKQILGLLRRRSQFRKFLD